MDHEFEIIQFLMDMLKQYPVHEYTLKEQLIAKDVPRKVNLLKRIIIFSIIVLNITPWQISLLHYSLLSAKENTVLDLLSQHMVTPPIA